MVIMVSSAGDVLVPKADIHHQEQTTLATTAFGPLQMTFPQQKYKRKFEIKPNGSSGYGYRNPQEGWYLEGRSLGSS